MRAKPGNKRRPTKWGAGREAGLRGFARLRLPDTYLSVLSLKRKDQRNFNVLPQKVKHLFTAFYRSKQVLIFYGFVCG